MGLSSKSLSHFHGITFQTDETTKTTETLGRFTMSIRDRSVALIYWG